MLLTIGMSVLIMWPGVELDQCRGRLVAKLDGLTALKDVVCPDGTEYYEVVGVAEHKLIGDWRD